MHKLLIHIGTEKTGSTSLQRFLSQNREALLSCHSVLYPEDDALFFNHGHFPIAAALLPPDQCDFLPSEKRIGVGRLFSTLQACIEREKPRFTVLSCEQFSSRFKPPAINRFAAALSDYEVQILVYLRPQEELALSALSTSLKRGRSCWFETDQLHPDDSYWNYEKMLDSWASAFSEGQIIVRPFVRGALVGGDVVGDFLDAASIRSDRQLPRSVDANTSISAQEARFLHALNQQLVDWPPAVESNAVRAYERGQLMRNTLMQVVTSRKCFLGSSPIRAILSDDQRSEIIGKFEQTNNAVARRFLGKERLFDNAAAPANAGNNAGLPELTDSDWARVALSCAERIRELQRRVEGMEQRIRELQRGQ
jgi:hypothetical protein